MPVNGINLLIEKFAIEETEENLDRIQQFILEDDFTKVKRKFRFNIVDNSASIKAIRKILKLNVMT